MLEYRGKLSKYNTRILYRQACRDTEGYPATLSKVEKEIKQLKTEYTQTLNPTLLAEIRNKLNTAHGFADSEVKYISRRYTARNYGKGGCPGHVLASRISQAHPTSHITQILDVQDAPHYDTPSIIRCFS